MDLNISETPEMWVILKIETAGEINYKVFGTWAGGYLGSDRWKTNSGIISIKQDADYYYFIGFSGSCYKCHKKTYGTITSFGRAVLNEILEKGDGHIVVLNDQELKIYIKTFN